MNICLYKHKIWLHNLMQLEILRYFKFLFKKIAISYTIKLKNMRYEAILHTFQRAYFNACSIHTFKNHQKTPTHIYFHFFTSIYYRGSLNLYILTPKLMWWWPSNGQASWNFSEFNILNMIFSWSPARLSTKQCAVCACCKSTCYIHINCTRAVARTPLQLVNIEALNY